MQERERSKRAERSLGYAQSHSGRSLPMLLKLTGGAGSRTPAAWVPAPPKWRLTCRDCPMEQRICRMTRSALQFLQCTKLCVSNSNLFLYVVEDSGRAPQISGWPWHVREGFWEALGSVLDGFGCFWEALEGSGWALADLDGFGWGSECSPGTDLDGPRRL